MPGLQQRRETTAIKAPLQGDKKWAALLKQLQASESDPWPLMLDHFGKTTTMSMRKETEKMVGALNYCNDLWTNHIHIIPHRSQPLVHLERVLQFPLSSVENVIQSVSPCLALRERISNHVAIVHP